MGDAQARRASVVVAADIERLNAMHPRCAKCGKLVDTLSWHCDPVRPYEIIFEASCHGETERPV